MSEQTDGGSVDLTDFSQDQTATGETAAAEAPPAPAAAPAASEEEHAEQRSAASLGAVFEVPVNIAAVLGRTHMEVSDLLKLDEGDVVELDRKVGEAIDIFVNNRLVARGEVVLVEDRLGVTMTEIIKSDRTG